MKYSLSERAELYNRAFPKYPKLVYDKNWLIGVWNMGNCYSGSGFYGSYPNSYLKRIRAVFPEFLYNETLHLFSGSLGLQNRYRDPMSKKPPYDFPGICFDCNKELAPDVVGDARELSNYFNEQFSIILADTPYSAKDAERYGTDMPNRLTVIKECYKVLKPDGFLVWMDQVLPMFRKKEFKRIGEIMITRSTNHRVRAAFIFKKV